MKILDVVKSFSGDSENLIERLLGSGVEKTPESIRELMKKFDLIMNYFPPKVGKYIEAIKIRDGLTMDIAVPSGKGPFPIFYLIHGGGWVGGNPRQYRKLTRRFAQAGFLTFTVDYGLAPEKPFPTAYDDCMEAYDWILENCENYKGDKNKIALGGDSAGGNISASVGAFLSNHEMAPKALVLMYGAFDLDILYHRPDKTKKDVEINEYNKMELYNYVDGDLSLLKSDPKVSPIHVAERFPTTHVCVGNADPLMEQADILVEKLKEYDIKHEYFVDEKMPHGYLQIEFMKYSKVAQKRIFDFLKREMT